MLGQWAVASGQWPVASGVEWEWSGLGAVGQWQVGQWAVASGAVAAGHEPLSP